MLNFRIDKRQKERCIAVGIKDGKSKLVFLKTKTECSEDQVCYSAIADENCLDVSKTNMEAANENWNLNFFSIRDHGVVLSLVTLRPDGTHLQYLALWENPVHLKMTPTSRI